MKKVNLFGADTKSLSAFISAQRRLNCYYEVLPSGEKDSKVVIRGTPGFTLFTTIPAAPIRGFLAVNNTLYVVGGNSLFSVNNAGVVTTIGSLGTITNEVVAMANNGVQLIIGTGSSGYIYTYSTSTLSIISSSGFPQSTTSIVFMNGFFVAQNPGTGQFFVSDVYDGTTWDPLQFATAETTPDDLLVVSALHGDLVLWCQHHTEFWQDNGGSPMPFAQLVGTAQDWGLAAVNSVAYFNNTLAFLAQNVQGQVQIMALNGYAPQRISNHNIENIINSFAVTSDAIALSYITDGHPMYQITFPSANRSFLYEGINNIWSEVQTGVSPQARHAANIGVSFAGAYCFSDSTTGNIYQFDNTVYTDNGTPIKRELDSMHIENQGNILGIDELWLDFELGQGLQIGQGSNPQIMLQVSKDNGNTFGNERWTSIGKVGQYGGPRAIYRRFGQSRDFVFKIRMTDPVPFILVRGSAIVRTSREAGK